ncbi:MAG: hypothetical protein R3C11_19420 [Planctomycetaceae bacterium]
MQSNTHSITNEFIIGIQQKRRLIYFIIGLLGVVFFYKDHNLFLSLNEFWLAGKRVTTSLPGEMP